MRVTRTPRVVQTVLLVQRGDSLLMRQRPPSGLWAGLWEFPTLEARGAGEVTAALAALGLRSHAAPRPLGELEHQLTHRRFVFRPLLVRIADRDGAARVTGRWVDRAQRAELAISTAHRKILARLDSWMRADP